MLSFDYLSAKQIWGIIPTTPYCIGNGTYNMSGTKLYRFVREINYYFPKEGSHQMASTTLRE